MGRFVRAKWLVLWSLWLGRVVRHPTPPVALSDGRLVRGQMAPDGSHAQYFGIPYATAHFSNRFQAPGPEPVWDGIFEAIDEHVRCPQKYTPHSVVGDENCLRLNVYVPAGASADKSAPVMVFIHGGGFKEGSSSRLLYGPDYLMAKGVVLVTFNYRLSILGFLCLGTKEAPGNVGMKDQVAALKWVQRNIRAFGGDPDNVTIFGESAGGVSVSYHVLSPMSEGLFHKAIAQSGSSLAPWAEQREPIQFARALAKALGKDVKDVQELYNLFKHRNKEDLLLTRIPVTKGQLILGQVLYTPCTERALDGVEPFLLNTPHDILSRGQYNKVPMMIGSNSDEGYFFGAMENEDSLKDVTFDSALPHDLEFPSRKERAEFVEQLKHVYGMSDEDISVQNIVGLSKLHGEPFFVYPGIAETEMLLNSTTHPIYNYVFAYDGWRNFPKWISGWRMATAPGASHADDLFYLFNLFPIPKLFESEMIDLITTMWTNFAKYGDPTPEDSGGGGGLGLRWRRSRVEAPHALLIDSPSPNVTRPLLYSRSLRAWHRAYTTYRTRKPRWPYGH